MFSFVLDCIGLFVLCCVIIYAIIWAIIGLKSYITWYRLSIRDLYFFEISVESSRFFKPRVVRYYANSYRHALNKYHAQYDVYKEDIITIRQLDKK